MDAPIAEDAARRVIGAVRHAFHGWRRCASPRRSATPWESELPGIATLFRAAQDAMVELQGTGLIVPCPGTVAATKHERRLLRATAAAQDADDALVDNFLPRLAPHPCARPVLARAVTSLAGSLSGCGHWLSETPFPAPTLRLLRLRGIDPAGLRVAWPASHEVSTRQAGDSRCGAPA